MVSTLLMPSARTRRAGSGDPAAPGGTGPTRILDLEHPRVRSAVRALGPAPRPEQGAATAVAALRRAHRWISAEVRPVYSVEENRPVSEVLRRGLGSCSQRMALLEAVARSWGVPTRVRGLVVDGAFWYPRFPRLRRIVPAQVVLAWPEFRLPGHWLPITDLFTTADGPAPRTGGGFTNHGPETLFEALSRTTVDWDGTAACPASGAPCDLSAHLLVDLGHYDSRDTLFAHHGQTLCTPVRLLAEPVLSRRRAGT